MTTSNEEARAKMEADGFEASVIGGDISEALDHAKSPMAALAAAYNHAPSPLIRDFINRKVTEILFNEMPKLGIMLDKSPVIKTDEVKAEFAIETVFRQAALKLDENAPEVGKEITATVRDIGTELAEVLDRGIRRVALQDPYLNREAYMDILSSHSQIIAAFTALPLNEEQNEIAREIFESTDS